MSHKEPHSLQVKHSFSFSVERIVPPLGWIYWWIPWPKPAGSPDFFTLLTHSCHNYLGCHSALNHQSLLEPDINMVVKMVHHTCATHPKTAGKTMSLLTSRRHESQTSLSKLTHYCGFWLSDRSQELSEEFAHSHRVWAPVTILTIYCT